MLKTTTVILTKEDVQSAIVEYIGLEIDDKAEISVVKSRQVEGGFRVEINEGEVPTKEITT